MLNYRPSQPCFSRITKIGLYFGAVTKNCWRWFPRQQCKIFGQKTQKINGGDWYKLPVRILSNSCCSTVRSISGYKRYCWSVSLSVGLPVTLLKFSPKIYLNRINAPLHPYVTDAVVFTVLFEFFLSPLRATTPTDGHVCLSVRLSVRLSMGPSAGCASFFQSTEYELIW